jgi:hypothetical protein
MLDPEDDIRVVFGACDGLPPDTFIVVPLALELASVLLFETLMPKMRVSRPGPVLFTSAVLSSAVFPRVSF